MNFLPPLDGKKKLEVLRMEVRLNKRQKMKQLFTKLGIKSDLSFKKLFKPAISKSVLCHYIDEVERKRSTLIDYKADGKALLADLIFYNPDLSLRRVLQIYGLKKVMDALNIRELQAMLTVSNQRTLSRLMAEVNDIQLAISQSPLSFIKKIIIKKTRS